MDVRSVCVVLRVKVRCVWMNECYVEYDIKLKYKSEGKVQKLEQGMTDLARKNSESSLD